MTVRGVFITGTDTGVGKTAVASALIRHLRQLGLRAGAYKPAVSGAEFTVTGEPVWGDAQQLSKALNRLDIPLVRISPQCFLAPLAPPDAARVEGRQVDSSLLVDGAAWWQNHCDWLVIEGAGGWLSPLSETASNADVAQRLGFPVLVVGRLGLGTINHTRLTIESVRARGLKVAGVVLSDVQPDPADLSRSTNRERIVSLADLESVEVVEHQTTGDLLRTEGFFKMDWLQCFDEASPKTRE